MLLMCEQVVVEDCGFEIGNLQLGQQYLYLWWEIVVFEDEFEEYVDQVDGVFVD